MAVSPPKPWEQSQNTPTTSSLPMAGESSSSSSGGPSTSAQASSSESPPLPPRPGALLDSNSALGSRLGSVNPSGYSSLYSSSPYTSRYGSYGLSSGYGGYGGYGGSTYGGYSRLGGMGSYGGYGGYGAYGGGLGFGGYGGFGGMNNQMGINGPVDPSMMQPSLSQTLANSTQSTFQLLESLVMAFSGFSQLLESTFMMTHSSFFTFIQLIEQFNLFKFSIGKILSLFDLLKWLKGLITGTNPSKDSAGGDLWSANFRNFDPNNLGDPQKGSIKPPRPSRKPIVIFFLTVFGIPYLMNKLVRSIMAKQKQQQSLPANRLDPTLQDEQQVTLSIDPSKLTFVRAIHPYHPRSAPEDDLMNRGSLMEKELRFEKNEVIAVLLPLTGEERETMGWWKGRTRDGRIGWFPKNYVQEILLNQPPKSQSAHLETARVESDHQSTSAHKAFDHHQQYHDSTQASKLTGVNDELTGGDDSHGSYHSSANSESNRPKLGSLATMKY